MLPDPGPTPPPLPMPPIPGELTPSPTSSPSPAPAKRIKTSKVIQSLDAAPIHTATPPTHLTHTAVTPPAQPTMHTQHTGAQTSTSSPHTHTPTVTRAKDTLPQLDQLEEAANLRYLAKPKRTPTRDPLDKYTQGVQIQIHDAHPSSVYDLIAPETYKEWENLAESKLLAIPFENEKRTKDSNEKIGKKIFSAVREITNSTTLGVAAPLPNKESLSNDQVPNTFLIYNLSEVHRQILIQQTVWSSTNITFRVTTPSMKLPTFMFAIKDLRTMDPNLVRNMIKDVWNDETTSDFILNGVLAIEESARNQAIHAIHAFLDSVWVSRLETCLSGGVADPTYNVHMDGSIINDVKMWSRIRTHLVQRNYHNNSLGQGRVLIAPYHCNLCHGVDHPRGLCPFPAVRGWQGPTWRNQANNQRRGTGNPPLA